MKLNYFGYVRRINSKQLTKTVVFGVLESPNKPGRYRRKWPTRRRKRSV